MEILSAVRKSRNSTICCLPNCYRPQIADDVAQPESKHLRFGRTNDTWASLLWLNMFPPDPVWNLIPDATVVESVVFWRDWVTRTLPQEKVSAVVRELEGTTQIHPFLLLSVGNCREKLPSWKQNLGPHHSTCWCFDIRLHRHQNFLKYMSFCFYELPIIRYFYNSHAKGLKFSCDWEAWEPKWRCEKVYIQGSSSLRTKNPNI